MLIEQDTGKAAADDGDRIEKEVELRHRGVDPEKEDSQWHDDADDVSPLEVFNQRPNKEMIEICGVDGCSAEIQQKEVEETKIGEAYTVSGESAMVLDVTITKRGMDLVRIRYSIYISKKAPVFNKINFQCSMYHKGNTIMYPSKYH